jgi:hypothetical protein
MYSGKNIRQQKLDGIVKPFNLELNQTKQWVRMSELIPWEEMTGDELKQLVKLSEPYWFSKC